jgi:glycosyltransferase involved in cell wall biosynthesis
VLSEPVGVGAAAEAERRWSHLQVPAKVYEYLRLGRPMLALVSGGAVAELLGQTHGGVVVAPDDIEGIARRLGELYQHQTAPSPPLPALVEGYTRENLTKRLVEELNVLTKE